jgi:hypothetical protein
VASGGLAVEIAGLKAREGKPLVAHGGVKPSPQVRLPATSRGQLVARFGRV